MSRLPRSSPWGKVQHCEELHEGVFKVSTASHGGIMVRYANSNFLSSEALKSGFRANRSFCFEEDCDAQIVMRELLDKKMWEIPDRIIDKTQYKEKLNLSLRLNHPEYWEARQKTLSRQIEKRKESDTMTDARKNIIFRDEDYKVKFMIKDGESIKITYSYDGEEVIRKCRYLDEHHLNVGSNCYHIDEFMEKMTRAKNTYEPIPNQTPKIDIVIMEPGKKPIDTEIPMTHNALFEILSGQPKILQKDKFTAVVNGTNGNGTIAAFGLNGENLTSLHPYDAQKYKRDFSEHIPGLLETQKPTLAEKLERGAAKAAEHNAEVRKTNDKRKSTEIE